MKIISSIHEMQAEAERIRLSGKRIGVVPTMGYLHRGHTSLIEIARQKADVVVTTIFVNPTQFGPGEDFDRYPRDLERDRVVAQEAGTDVLFTPVTQEMYPPGFGTYVTVEGASEVLEGTFRPTHFRGVTTVVMKLLLITKPHVAVFGQKDAQQAFIIRKMVRELNVDTDVIDAPIVREPDGLALSSRNVYLSRDERRRATSLYQSLQLASARIRSGDRSVDSLRKEMMDLLIAAQPTEVDYVAFVDPTTFREVEVVAPPHVLALLAVRFGATRLIDNLLISVP
jgi:pantoate--beta-alanine ligase